MINERFIIKDKLGEGRSAVFICEDLDNSKKEFAIKILSPNAGEEEKLTFKKEFITLDRFDHPNIIKVNDFGTVVKKNENDKEIEIGSEYFTLEYFKGINLLEYQNLDDEIKLKKILTQLCSAIYYFHQSNYIYYDLKPENILINEINNEPVIKLIDFGFIEKANGKQEKSIKGTAEYIAPELLKNQAYDFRIDLYSLGIILYQIIYKKFPFDIDNELSIYKAHLEQEFEFEKTNYSGQIINIVKKLLQKEPDERYQNILEVLEDLNESIDSSLTKQWIPAKIFADREEALNELDQYLNNKTSSDVYTIKGFEGSGKSFLTDELFFIYENSVLIKNNRTVSGAGFICFLLKNILFKEFIYQKLDKKTIQKAEALVNDLNFNLNDIKAVFNSITKVCSFILILDDFNLYDDLTLEILKELIPIFQANKEKIILTEESDFSYKSDFIFNLKEINLKAFSDVQIEELLQKSFHFTFPKDDLKKIILLYADLLPGNIFDFIKDILQLEIIKFSSEGVKINVTEDLDHVLKSSHDKIYELRLEGLRQDQIRAAEILSIFAAAINKNILAGLLNEPEEKVEEILIDLELNNIANSNLQFTSESLKKYIYSKIENKIGLHFDSAEFLKKEFPNFDRKEIARQYELAEQYEMSYQVLKAEMKSAKEISAYSYEKNILKHLLTLPLEEKSIIEIEAELSRVLKMLNESKDCLELTEKLISKVKDEKLKTELEIQKGICTISLGELEKGKEILNSILNKIKNPALNEEVKLEIAYAEFDLNNYELSEKISNNIVSNKIADKITTAKTFNLLALLEIYHKNRIDNAIVFFNNSLNIYSELNLLLQVSKIYVNLGNIYNIKGEFDKALENWDKALELNNSIGNLEQEAKILLGYGAYYYSILAFEKAIGFYNRANDIFTSYGDITGQSLILNNLAETYLPICEYQKCYESLKKAFEIFKLQKEINEAEILFIYGKLFYEIGDAENLKKNIDLFEEINIKTELSEIQKNHLELLNLLYLEISGKDIIREIENLIKIRDKYLELDDKYNFAYVNFFLVEKLIRAGNFDRALEELNNKDYTAIINPNLLNAERNFLLALISKNCEACNLEPSVELLEKTYAQIKEESITELTWKVLFELADSYFKRGNAKKANEYAEYAKALLFFIADNIEDERLKENYLNFAGRKKAVEKLNQIENNL